MTALAVLVGALGISIIRGGDDAFDRHFGWAFTAWSALVIGWNFA